MVKLQSFPVHLLLLVQLAACPIHNAQIAVILRHALLAAQGLVKLQSFPVHLLGLVQVAACLIHNTQIADGFCLPRLVLMRLSQGQHLAKCFFRLRQLPCSPKQLPKLVPAICIVRVKLCCLAVGKQGFFGVVHIRQCAQVPGGSSGLLVGLLAFRLLGAQHLSKDGLGLGRVALLQLLQGCIDACRRRAGLGQSGDCFGQCFDLLILGLELPLQRRKQRGSQRGGILSSFCRGHAVGYSNITACMNR